MATLFFRLELHAPDHRSTDGGGWIVPMDHTCDEEGWPRLTPHCASLGELEANIDRMIKDLEEMRSIARSQFADFKDMPPKPVF